MANNLKRKGALDEAIAAYREVLRLKPDLGVVHDNLGFALRDQGKLDEAIACFHKAIACYHKAIEVDPKNAFVHNNLAWLLATAPDANLRDPPRAVEAARTAVQLSEENGGYHNTLGVALYRNGEYQEAIAALEKSLALSKDQLVADNGLFIAMARWQLGEKESARQWFDKSVQWMEAHQQTDEELKRVHAEAAALLGPPGKAAP
jgi:superkiller protein 3